MADIIEKVNFVGRLNRAAAAWKKLKKTTTTKNMKMLRTYASNYYKKPMTEDSTASECHPINMIDRTVNIWLPFLVGGLPKITIEPRINLQLKPFAHTFQQAINQLLKNMKFGIRTLEPAVFNSLFGMSIVKTGTKEDGDIDIRGSLNQIGRPYSEIVDEDNYIGDITAKDREQYEFEGDSFIVPTKLAKEEFLKFADKITPDFKLYGEQHPKSIENPEKVSYGELHDYTELVNYWLPKERVIITTLPHYKNFNKILKTVQYDGPPSGPYDVLFYKGFPGSTIPIPPIYTLMEMDTSINTMYAKARKQAESIKKIGVGSIGSPEDADTAKSAVDGNMYLFSNAADIKDLTLGGVVPEIYDFIGFSLDQFSQQAGNLSTAGGRKSMSKTLGQEEMLMANASRMLNSMSQKVHYFASSIAEKIAYELWQNPTMQISAMKRLPGIAEISVLYNQLQQEGNFTDYELDVNMTSMQKLAPEQKFQKAMQLLTGWILPTAQIAAQQGKQLNVPEITSDLSNYMDLNTESWFLSEVPMAQQTPGLNANQPMGQGDGMKSSDQRFGASESDNMNNKLQQQNASKGKTTEGM